MKKILVFAIAGLVSPFILPAQEKVEASKTEIGGSVSYCAEPKLGDGRAVIGQFLFATKEGEFRAGVGRGWKFHHGSFGILAGVKNDPQAPLNGGAWFAVKSKELWEASGIAMIGNEGLWLKAGIWFVIEIDEKSSASIGAWNEGRSLGPAFRYRAGVASFIVGFLDSWQHPGDRLVNFGFEFE